ncbi:U-box domain protein [Hokovirus HKV1]|uniref:U-box domain protein n=1 Tax=Hokovirus HKV1 TaxID=1977638 RepID=A0A1V0SEH7_9VIRU|nr:U-box domain protein [Hokovirus HKV1]
MDKYICPITKSIFLNPCLAGDGFNYEKEVIEDFLTKYSISPTTGKPMAKTLLENLTLRLEVNEYLLNNPSQKVNQYYNITYMANEEKILNHIKEKNYNKLLEYCKYDLSRLYQHDKLEFLNELEEKILNHVLNDSKIDSYENEIKNIIKTLKPINNIANENYINIIGMDFDLNFKIITDLLMKYKKSISMISIYNFVKLLLPLFIRLCILYNFNTESYLSYIPLYFSILTSFATCKIIYIPIFLIIYSRLARYLHIDNIVLDFSNIFQKYGHNYQVINKHIFKYILITCILENIMIIFNIIFYDYFLINSYIIANCILSLLLTIIDNYTIFGYILISKYLSS